MIDTHASSIACAMTSKSKDFCLGDGPRFFALTLASSRGTSENSPGLFLDLLLLKREAPLAGAIVFLDAIDLENYGPLLFVAPLTATARPNSPSRATNPGRGYRRCRGYG